MLPTLPTTYATYANKTQLDQTWQLQAVQLVAEPVVEMAVE